MGQSVGIEVCRGEACRSFTGIGEANGEECPNQNLGDSLHFTKLPPSQAQQDVPDDWQLVPRKINPANFTSLPPLTEENGTMLEPITEDAEEGMVSQFQGEPPKKCCNKDESTTIPSTDEDDSDGQQLAKEEQNGQDASPREAEAPIQATAAAAAAVASSSSSGSLGLSGSIDEADEAAGGTGTEEKGKEKKKRKKDKTSKAASSKTAADTKKEAEEERRQVQKRKEANLREQQRQQQLLEAMSKDVADSDSDSEVKLDVCPGSKKDKDFERELKKVKRKMKQAEAASNGLPVADDDGTWRDVNPLLNSQASEQERKVKKDMILSFYRDEFARVAKEKGEAAAQEAGPDLKQYDDGAIKGLKIQGGHRYMPRPDGVELPKDFRTDVGVLTKEELAKYGADNDRILVCIHGDLFDVSDRPDKYGTEGPYWYMSGHDITWGFVIADDGEEWIDIYYDVFKIYPAEKSDRKLQGLLSWWAFYEKEYGRPVGRLDVYETEWKLPAPPKESMENECSIM